MWYSVHIAEKWLILSQYYDHCNDQIALWWSHLTSDKEITVLITYTFKLTISKSKNRNTSWAMMDERVVSNRLCSGTKDFNLILIFSFNVIVLISC